MVSIHAPTRGATADALNYPLAFILFQSTRPRGARPGLQSTGAPEWSSFNPRAHAGRDMVSSPRSKRVFFGFNPRAHAGRDGNYFETKPNKGVSIHAPTRGATRVGGAKTIVKLLFQSTRPRGARRLAYTRKGRKWRVSIHAPTRGATRLLRYERRRTAGVSIHAPTRGATSGRSTKSLSKKFQSTRPRGARQYIKKIL